MSYDKEFALETENCCTVVWLLTRQRLQADSFTMADE